MSDERAKVMSEDMNELKEVLSVVSNQVPALIKSLIGSVFSEEAGRDMGKAVGAFYKGLVDSGIPAEMAVRMAEKYMSTFTSLGDVMKQAVGGKGPADGGGKEEKCDEEEGETHLSCREGEEGQTKQ
jgi:hypothetical protein